MKVTIVGIEDSIIMVYMVRLMLLMKFRIGSVLINQEIFHLK